MWSAFPVIEYCMSPVRCDPCWPRGRASALMGLRAGPLATASRLWAGQLTASVAGGPRANCQPTARRSRLRSELHGRVDTTAESPDRLNDCAPGLSGSLVGATCSNGYEPVVVSLIPHSVRSRRGLPMEYRPSWIRGSLGFAAPAAAVPQSRATRSSPRERYASS